MSDAVVLVLGVLEVAGIFGVFALARRNKARRAAGEPRPPKPVRIASALLLLLVVVGFPAVIISSFTNLTMQGERQRERLVEDGTPATATITRIEETGRVINRQPEVQVLVTVQPKDGPEFNSQSTWVFSVTDVQNYRVGAKVNVYFDPEDRGTVAIVGLVEGI